MHNQTPKVPKRGRNKFHARKTEYNGHVYDSRAEAMFAKRLDMLRSAKAPSERVQLVEIQPRFGLTPPPNKITYRADFRVSYADGHEVVYDVKGVMTRDAALRIKLMRHFHPDVDLRIVRVRPDKNGLAIVTEVDR